MKPLIACVIGVALLAGSAGLTIANAQQAQAPAFIAGDRPVTAEQVLQKLQTDGWSNVLISRDGRYIEVTGSMNGETSKMAVDSQTVAFAPTTTMMTTIEPDGAPVLLPESARVESGEGLGLRRLPSATAAPEAPRLRPIASISNGPVLSCALRFPLVPRLPQCICRRSSSPRLAPAEMTG